MLAALWVGTSVPQPSLEDWCARSWPIPELISIQISRASTPQRLAFLRVVAVHGASLGISLST